MLSYHTYTMPQISEFEKVSNSISLAKIGEKPFTILAVERSDYTSGDESTEGVKITIKETFEGVNVLHTTRVAIVKKMKEPAVLKTLAVNEPIGPVKCVEGKTEAGKKFFKLVDA